MRILEICEFSSGLCGVWQRAKQESLEMIKKGHEVIVFSSNIEKGTGKIVGMVDKIDGIDIYRFPSRKSRLSEHVNYFDFSKKLEEVNPNVIITHSMHPHSFLALSLAKKLKIPAYLVPHAPFGIKRKFLLNLATRIYNYLKVKRKIRQFTKVIAITKWEIPYLIKLGVKQDKIVYIPNGIPEDFFKPKIKPFKGKKLVFYGRVSPVKNLEILIKAFNELNDKNLELEIIGPIDKGYEQIINLAQGSKKIKFLEGLYDRKKLIKKINESDIFVLPSWREAMPQSLIEAKALGKIVISSNNSGSKELIKEGVDGFLFEVGSVEGLKNILVKAKTLSSKEAKSMQLSARKNVEMFKWSVISKKLNEILSKNEKA